MAIAMNRRIGAIAHFDTLLAGLPGVMAGWGRKASGRRAQWLARVGARVGARAVLVEDGFLCSLEREGARLSLLVDPLGVYYDARTPSGVERAIAQGVSPAEEARSNRLIAQWREGGLSKYNHAPDYTGPLPARYVLVADQCQGDMSIAGGLAGPDDFSAMLAAALAENRDAMVVVKAHPDAFSHGRASCFSAAALAHPRIMVIAQACHPLRLITHAEKVYTVTSQIGFEALLHGVPLRCFGMPFYAGWGLSDDEREKPSRRGKASLAALAHGAFVACTRYVDPTSGAPWEPEHSFAHAARALARARAEHFAAMCTAPWLIKPHIRALAPAPTGPERQAPSMAAKLIARCASSAWPATPHAIMRTEAFAASGAGGVFCPAPTSPQAALPTWPASTTAPLRARA